MKHRIVYAAAAGLCAIAALKIVMQSNDWQDSHIQLPAKGGGAGALTPRQNSDGPGNQTPAAKPDPTHPGKVTVQSHDKKSPAPVPASVIENARLLFQRATEKENGSGFYISIDDGDLPAENAQQIKTIIKQGGAGYFRFSENDDIKPVTTKHDDLGNTYYTFQQYYKNIPVHGTTMVVRTNPGKQISSLIGRFESGLMLESTPALSADAAISQGIGQLQATMKVPDIVDTPQLNIHFDDDSKTATLVYSAMVDYIDKNNSHRIDEILIDANQGELVAAFTRLRGFSPFRRTLNRRTLSRPLGFNRPILRLPRSLPLPPPPVVPLGPIILPPPVVLVPPFLPRAPLPPLFPRLPLPPIAFPVPNFPAPNGPLPPIVSGPKFPFPVPNSVPSIPNAPNRTSKPTTGNASLTREIYRMPAGNACIGIPGMSDLPGQFQFKEGGSGSNDVDNQVYARLGDAYWFYKHMFNRNSWDDNGLTIRATNGAEFFIRGNCTPNNAMYHPVHNQLAFGRGLQPAIDLVAHEFSHGVTMNSSKIGDNEEGASMNEALSDVFGAGVEAWIKSGGSKDGNPAGGISTQVVNDADTWLMCENCGSGFPPRYMSNPELGESSLHKSRYYYADVNWQGDEGKNAHGNGGIFTMAFYLLTAGGQNSKDPAATQVTGIGMDKALRIFYRGSFYQLGPKSKYKDARNAMAEEAKVLRQSEGNGNESCSPYWRSVNQAFDAVGVEPGSWSRC